MSTDAAVPIGSSEREPVRILGRGLRARKGVHLTFRAIREALGQTQVEVSERSQINQADISRLESRPDFDECQVSTLRRYVQALGGSFELVVSFNGKRIILSGAEDEKGAGQQRTAPNRTQGARGSTPGRRGGR